MGLTKATNRMIADAPVNVKDYGAVGDGVTDDTAAIQAAVNAMTDGSTISFPQGNYSISGQVSFDNSNISVVGEKAKIIQTGSKKRSFNFDTVSYIEVTGFHFYGLGSADHDGANMSAALNAAAIWFDTCSHLDVHDNFIENHAGGHIRSRYDGSYSRFTNNRVVGIGTAGGIVSSDNNVDAGIDIREAAIGGSKNIVISDNDISDTCFGIFVHHGDGIVISNNTVRSIKGQHGIYATQNSNVSISNNTFDDIALLGMKAQQITTASGVFYNFSVVGNVINNAQTGIIFELGSGDPDVTYTEGVTISGNTITNITIGYGMSLDSCRQLNVVGNTIDRTGSMGIYIRNSGQAVVSNNYINLAGGIGIWCADLYDDCVIDGNYIRDAVQNYDAGTGVAFLYYIYVQADAAATGTPKCFIKSNIMITDAASPALFSKCIRVIPSIDTYMQHNTNLTGKSWQIDAADIKQLDFGHSPNVDFTSGGTADPTTPVYGHGRRQLYGTQDPATATMTDTFNDGDICWKANPAAGGTIGWVCTTAGTPGTWKTFGAITA
jgi:parallel beta-helix repeat protein